MADMIMNSDVLPEPIHALIGTKKIRVRESNGVVSILPLDDACDYIARVKGSCNDGRLTVDKFMEQKCAEKELEL